MELMTVSSDTEYAFVQHIAYSSYKVENRRFGHIWTNTEIERKKRAEIGIGDECIA